MKRNVEKIIIDNPKTIEFFNKVEKRKEELRDTIMKKLISKGMIKEKQVGS